VPLGPSTRKFHCQINFLDFTLSLLLIILYVAHPTGLQRLSKLEIDGYNLVNLIRASTVIKSMEIIAVLLGVFGLGTGAGLLVIRNYYHICQPSEVLIFAGSRRPTATGKTIGYRLVKGGSSIRLPMLEQVYRMDLTNMIIDLRVVNAYSKGGVPLIVTGVANIKIAGEEPIIHNAI